MWGVDLPAVDIDFMLVEYHGYKPAALIEYKHWNAPKQKRSDNAFKPLVWLADGRKIPCFAVRYNPDNWTFVVVPLNKRAEDFLERSEMIEEDYIRLLYKLRGQEPPADLGIGSPLFPQSEPKLGIVGENT